MYQLSVFVFMCTLLQQIAADVVMKHEPISFKFDDLYSQCTQFGGSKLCLGAVTRENEKYKLPKSDCVRSKSCVLLFQFFAVDNQGKHYVITCIIMHLPYALSRFDRRSKCQVSRLRQLK